MIEWLDKNYQKNNFIIQKGSLQMKSIIAQTTIDNLQQQQIDTCQENSKGRQMEIENQSVKGGKRARPQQQKAKDAPAKKDLLRLEREIFELKKSQEGDSEYVIRKLMAKKEKPQIGMVHQSPLLSRLKQLMPVFNKSNEQLLQRPIEQSQKIDVQLQECESSSSSSDSDQQSQQKQTQVLKSKIHDMDIEQTNNSASQNEMQNEAQQAEVNEVEINFLRYPYLSEEMLAKLEKEKLNKPKEDEDKKKKQKKQKKKKVLIEEITQK